MWKIFVTMQAGHQSGRLNAEHELTNDFSRARLLATQDLAAMVGTLLLQEAKEFRVVHAEEDQ